MYSQFKQRETHQMEKYIGKLARHRGKELEVVGYSVGTLGDFYLIVDASLFGGWHKLDAYDVIFKECKSYWYVGVSNLIY